MAREPRNRNRPRVLALALFAALLWPALLWPASARADANAEFLAASAEAYAPYRGAVAYLHTGNPGLAALALDAMAARWAGLCDRFRNQPPAAFAQDPAWRASLDDITSRVAEARAKIEAGDGKGAETALKPIRAALGDLRRRNGIVTHSDRIDALSAAMDAIWVHRRNSPDMADPQVLAALAEQARTLRRTLEDVAAGPPEKIVNDPQFLRLIEGSFIDVATIDRAIEARDPVLLISALRGIRSSERLLWMNFG
ncbi:MAG: hypothetical protein ACTSQ7_16820 [Alphaproteobacteria bacterium]